MTFPTLEVQLTREHYMMQRQALLLYLDALEQALDIHPRTAELRRQAKDERDREKIHDFNDD